MAVRRARTDDSWAKSDDGRLVAATCCGEMEAFGQLYRRYADQAWRVARRVTDNEDDARDAVAEAFAKVLRMLRSDAPPAEIDFGPYLRIATRHAAVDVVRSKARVSPARDLETLDVRTGFDQPDERAVANEEGRLISEALSALSDREQLVLWLLEVEDKSLRAAATVLGVKPNHVAQIAMRARRRLRRGFMQAHMRNHVLPACGFAVEHLPAYVDSELGQHSRKRIDEHVNGCSECRQRLDDLKDLGLKLRGALLFPPLLRSRMPKWWRHRDRSRPGSRRVKDALQRASADGSPDVGALAMVPGELARGANSLATATSEIASALGAAAPAVQQFIAAASATVLVLGLAALDGGADPTAGSTAPRASQEASVVAVFDGPGILPVGRPSATSIGSGASGEVAAPLSPGPDRDAAAPAHAGPATDTGLEGAKETPAVGHASAARTSPPVHSAPEGSAGLGRTDVTTTTEDMTSAAPGPTTDAPAVHAPPPHAAPGGPIGPERANETPAASQASPAHPPGTAPGPPAHVPTHVPGSPANAPGAAPGPPAHAGPPSNTGIERAKETPAASQAPGPPPHAAPPDSRG